MAIDQATLAAALTDFAADVTAGLAAVEAAIPEAVDLQAEFDTLTSIKNEFDAFVAKVVPPAPEPAPEAPPA